MIKVAITGNAGSGKSTIAGELLKLGATAISADAINTSLLMYCTLIQEWLEAALDRSLSGSDSELDTQLLRNIVFKSPENKSIAEQLLHPIIKSNIELQLSISTNRQYCIVEIPLLFEAGMHSLYDRIILVQSYRELLIDRISRRPDISRTMAESILDAQPYMDIKLELTDDIITNNHSMDNMTSSAERIHESILEQAEHVS